MTGLGISDETTTSTPASSTADSTTARRTVLQRTVACGSSSKIDDNSHSDPTMTATESSSSNKTQNHLRLMMLGCEDHPPYGPNEHTAAMFLDLICRALERLFEIDDSMVAPWNVSITIYHVKKFDYPTNSAEWDAYDGILLPGSFSSAYDETDWIQELKRVLKEHVHGRPTLGICFGHQIYAHALQDGLAVKCPVGPQAGRRPCTLSDAGKTMFSSSSSSLATTTTSTTTAQLQLYYTHGDMVQQLPSCAVSLGGNEKVPILAAAYFCNQQEAQAYVGNSNRVRPTAITFQAHPEYAASLALGVKQTLHNILMSMQERGDIGSEEERAAMEQDALDNYELVERDSVEAMRRVGDLMGWFPAKTE